MRSIGSVVGLVVFVGCGASDNNLASDDGGFGDGGGNVVDAVAVDFADADPLAPDAGPSGGCVPGGSQCNNCIDDDGDGLIDGFDPECTGLLDDREDSFATGIPGDNIDAVKQDCFFDGNSGAGDDGCDMHVCCLLDECPSGLPGPPFDPTDCVVSQECIDNCAPLTPPGCDCFGCCTLCNDAGCFDVLTNPAVAPDCTLATIDDPAKCPTCTPVADCGGGDCNALECVLCPGQTESDLPASCASPECPAGLSTCAAQSDCTATQFCANGCCINSVD